MKHLLIFLVSTAALISVQAKIPDYIKTCHEDDPHINMCILNTINGLRDRLVQGMPELGVPSIDPLHIDRVNLELGPGFKMFIENLELEGLKHFEMRNVTVDLDADTYAFDISFPAVTVKGTYDVNATLAVIPLQGKGPVTITAKLVTGQGILQAKKVKRGDETFMYFSRMINFRLNMKDYVLKLEDLFGGDPTIGEATNKLLNEEKTEVLKSLLPGLEKAVVEKILSIANNICKNFTRAELFPKS